MAKNTSQNPLCWDLVGVSLGVGGLQFADGNLEDGDEEKGLKAAYSSD